MNDVFVSYAREDGDIAEELTAILTDTRVTFFRDVKDIDWGDQILESLHDALSECVALLVVVSPSSLASPWVPYEIGHASALRRMVLPYVADAPENIPQYIRNLSCVTGLDVVRAYFTDRFPAVADRIRSRMVLADPSEPARTVPWITEAEIEVLKRLEKGSCDVPFMAKEVGFTRARVSYCFHALRDKGFAIWESQEWQITNNGTEYLIHNGL